MSALASSSILLLASSASEVARRVSQSQDACWTTYAARAHTAPPLPPLFQHEGVRRECHPRARRGHVVSIDQPIACCLHNAQRLCVGSGSKSQRSISRSRRSMNRLSEQGLRVHLGALLRLPVHASLNARASRLSKVGHAPVPAELLLLRSSSMQARWLTGARRKRADRACSRTRATTPSGTSNHMNNGGACLAMTSERRCAGCVCMRARACEAVSTMRRGSHRQSALQPAGSRSNTQRATTMCDAKAMFNKGAGGAVEATWTRTRSAPG